ncbi:MAG: DUF2271 domain-containing protein [Planctomycetota bacterium]
MSDCINRRAITPCLCALPAILVGATVSTAPTDPTNATPACFDIIVQLADGMKTTHDQPRVVLWLEDKNKRFVRTLYRFGQEEPKHYKDLPVSYGLSQKAEQPAELDAITGATIIWGNKGQARIPSRWKGLDVLSGGYSLRIESAKDHGKHFATFTIPLDKNSIGKTFQDKGYVTTLDIKATPAKTASPTDPTFIPVANSPPPQLAPGKVELAVCTGTVISTAPATKQFPNAPSFKLRLDDSGDVVEFWPPGPKRPECAAMTKAVLAVKVDARITVTYTESKGSRAFDIVAAPPAKPAKPAKPTK